MLGGSSISQPCAGRREQLERVAACPRRHDDVVVVREGRDLRDAVAVEAVPREPGRDLGADVVELGRRRRLGLDGAGRADVAGNGRVGAPRRERERGGHDQEHEPCDEPSSSVDGEHARQSPPFAGARRPRARRSGLRERTELSARKRSSPRASASASRCRYAADSSRAASAAFRMFPVSISTFGTSERLSPPRSERTSSPSRPA